MSDKVSYVYMLACADGTLYTGWTVDLQQRIKAHNQGKASKYTRARRPVKQVYHECFGCRKEAMQREYFLKRLTRAEKLTLIKTSKKGVSNA